MPEFLRIKPTKEFMDELGNELKINQNDYNQYAKKRQKEKFVNGDNQEVTLVITSIIN